MIEGGLFGPSGGIDEHEFVTAAAQRFR